MAINPFTFKYSNPRGFTVLFAVLVASLLLSVGLVIFEITYKEVSFATVVRDSNFAIYAADTGIECALYWDHKYHGSGTGFATSTTYQGATSGLYCNGQDITPEPGSTPVGPNSATTTFTITFPPQQYCTFVTVIKNYPNTTIYARGYNTCLGSAPNRIERALQANY